MVLNGGGGNFASRGTFATSGNIFGYHTRGDTTGIRWVEVRDTAKHPTTTGELPTTKNYPAPNAISAKVEKP